MNHRNESESNFCWKILGYEVHNEDRSKYEL